MRSQTGERAVLAAETQNSTTGQRPEADGVQGGHAQMNAAGEVQADVPPEPHIRLLDSKVTMEWL